MTHRSSAAPRRFLAMAIAGALLALAACFNIYVQFPTAEFEQAFRDYARKTYGGMEGAEPDVVPAEEERADDDEKSGCFDGLGLFRVVHAAEGGGGVDIQIDTPAIRAIHEKQKARLKKLKPQFETGRVGIAATGDLVVRNEDGLDLKAKKEMRENVEAENQSRAELYKEVARANKVEPARVEEIRKLFAAAWIDEAPAGWWVQVDGKWLQKPPKK